MKRFWQIGNIVALGFALAGNYLIGAQIFSLPQIDDISATYATLLTPAGYAFSIWSLIYVLLVVFVVYQARDIVRPKTANDLPERIGPLFIIAGVCNGLWPFVFVKEWLGLSVVVLVALTVSLFVILQRLNIALDNPPIRDILFVWWPLMIYTGWVIVASVVNLASWLDSLGIQLGTLGASLVVMSLAVGLIVLVLTRAMREVALAASWGLIAVGVEQSQVAQDVAAATITFTAVGLVLVAVVLHGYLNRNENPFVQRLTS